MTTESLDELVVTFDAERRVVGAVPPVKCGLCGEAAPGRILKLTQVLVRLLVPGHSPPGWTWDLLWARIPLPPVREERL